VLRKSFGFGILATVAANGGLWYFLDHQDGLGLLEHPQLWLIPPALCVLVAAHLNRRQMTAEQSTAVRYGAASVVYAASTADIFLNGVAEAPYLPLVLAAFAIAGMLAGIALRIRAFLYLGLTFLMLALATIIWHAGYNLDRTWIFYVTGIVSGVLIIALFAVFEKKREEVLRVVETLKEWD
jgi:fructose-specific phosphotransferase system IIC component